MKIDCEIDYDAKGGVAKILPRAPNYSGLALLSIQVSVCIKSYRQ